MNALQFGPAPEDFVWAGGIEDTFVPQARPGQRPLDEYELMGHYDHWREDLALARELGLHALRWGVPWYRVESQRGSFDWRWTDQVIPYLVEELGIVPIIDLMHYGCPLWLQREFDNPAYPEAVAAYAAAFARRYRGLVRYYTPLNEPLVNALMCGRRGLWPPYLRGERGYVRVMMQVTRGIFRTVASLRDAQPDAVMVHVEAAGWRRSATPELEPLAREDMLQHFLCYDLLTGRVTPEHPLFSWLVRHGTPPRDLAAFAREPLDIEVLGLNFYPQWGTYQLYLNRRGELASRIVEKRGEGFAELLAAYHARYGAPLMVTETSAFGSPAVRAHWLDASLAAIKQLRAQGVPVLGYTWFPIFTMIDWRYRFGKRPLDAYRLELGFYTLNDDPTAPRWQPTPLAERFRRAVRHPAETIGPLV